MPRLLTITEAAELLSIPVGTLTAWISTGRVDVPYYRLAPRTVRFDEAELLAWLESRRSSARRKLQARKNELDE